jgi:hypothetical protein
MKAEVMKEDVLSSESQSPAWMPYKVLDQIEQLILRGQMTDLRRLPIFTIRRRVARFASHAALIDQLASPIAVHDHLLMVSFPKSS